VSNYSKLAGNSISKVPKQLQAHAWPKGVSGNPSGRPPKSLYQHQIEDLLNDPKKVPQLVQAAFLRMLEPTMVGAIELRNSKEFVDGMVEQKLEVTDATVTDRNEARERIAKLEAELGYLRTTDQAGGTGEPSEATEETERAQ
jgi:hypothetical protein